MMVFESICVFGDASREAYFSVIYAHYLKVDGSYSCWLICSKTRVALVK